MYKISNTRKDKCKGAYLQVERTDDGRLFLYRDEKKIYLVAKKCFPWGHSGHFISLRDDKDQEVFLIEELSQLDQCSRDNIAWSLKRSEFNFEIIKFFNIEDIFELRSFSVSTKQGPMKFQTKLDYYPVQIGKGEFMIQDIFSDIFRFNLDDLDLPSKEQILVFID